jgi:hypothetical protein
MESLSVVLSFIGPMPPYIYECLKQLRLFFDGPIYVIYDLISPELSAKIQEFNLQLVPYESVKSERFAKVKKDFAVVEKLKDRKLLFMRSFERFYLLDELMKQRNLKYIWFMELDILMYTSPNSFFNQLKEVPTAYAYHRTDHCNSGIFYVKDSHSLQPILSAFDSFNNGFQSEMRALYDYMNKTGSAKATLFPLVIKSNENPLYWKDVQHFEPYLFDGAILGMYYFGVDPIHTNGQLLTQDPNVYDLKNKFLNIWKYGDLIWEQSEKGLIPYFKLKDSDEKKPIANLHIHSKDLKSAVSYR